VKEDVMASSGEKALVRVFGAGASCYVVACHRRKPRSNDILAFPADYFENIHVEESNSGYKSISCRLVKTSILAIFS
jgi:hypothetical protein